MFSRPLKASFHKAPLPCWPPALESKYIAPVNAG